MKRSGFTLIELLVVIAIIAILAAILFPVFARARAKAQQNNCLSNIKQLQLSVIMYASDNDDFMPSNSNNMAMHNPALGCVNGWQEDWIAQVFPYTKNGQIFLCPTVSAAVSNICPGVPVNSTVYNMDLDTYKQGMVVSPAQCVSLIDSTNCGNYCWASGDYGFVLHYTYGSASPATYGITKHNEGTNFGFVDGHAKWLTPVSVGYTSAQQYDYGPAWTGSLHTGSYGAWTSPAS